MVKSVHNLMAYNMQIAVDSKYKFIVATDTIDSNLLLPMAKEIKDNIKEDKLTLTADTGYYSAKDIVEM